MTHALQLINATDHDKTHAQIDLTTHTTIYAANLHKHHCM